MTVAKWIRELRWWKNMLLTLVLACNASMPSVDFAQLQRGGRQMSDHHWGEITEGLAISLFTEQEEFPLGTRVTVRVLMKNFGKSATAVVTRSPWIDYKWLVTGPDEKALSRTRQGEKILETAAEIGRSNRQLMPGEMIADTLDLTEAYDLHRSGTFKIVATREIYARNQLSKFTTVTSNQLVIKVRPSSSSN